jgi:hypothetical protein
MPFRLSARQVDLVLAGGQITQLKYAIVGTYGKEGPRPD